MGYFKETVEGLSWIGAFRVLTRGVALFRTALLARILLPAQFGLFGIASLVLAFLETVTETGVNIVLVQEEEDIDEYIDTAWIVSIARGILISLVLILAAPLIISFFKSPESYPLLLLISTVPLIRGFINPSLVKYQKELKFNKEFRFRTAIFLVDSLVAVILTFILKSPAGLVWGLIVGAVLEVFLSFKVVSPQPKFRFDRVKLGKVVSRGKWMTAAGIFDYLFSQGDDVVVGRFLGASSLGIYQIAYKISSLPITEVTHVFGKVTFPAYTKISKDVKELKNVFVKMVLSISLIVLPIGLTLFFFPEKIVILVLGEKWLEATSVLKVLSVFGVLKAISTAPYAVFLALKKQEYVTVSTLAGIVGLGATIIPLVLKFGIVGAAISTIIGTVSSLPFISYYTIKVFKEARA